MQLSLLPPDTIYLKQTDVSPEVFWAYSESQPHGTTMSLVTTKDGVSIRRVNLPVPITIITGIAKTEILTREQFVEEYRKHLQEGFTAEVMLGFDPFTFMGDTIPGPEGILTPLFHNQLTMDQSAVLAKLTELSTLLANAITITENLESEIPDSRLSHMEYIKDQCKNIHSPLYELLTETVPRLRSMVEHPSRIELNSGS